MATVLIVEDEDQVRVLAESYLREQGHQTVSAATAEEALAVFEVVARIDVLFIDVILRGEIHAGLEVAKRARERQPDLPVL
jgi:CheY-like chemotaxis protein